MPTQITSDKLTRYSSQWENRQPDNLNYLRPTAFRFLINTLPKVTYFCQSANIPELSLGTAMQSTPLVDIPYPGEKITFGTLTIKFMIQEDMANYNELFNWLIGLGFPKNRQQFKKYTEEHDTGLSDRGNGQFSDATLVILSSSNQPTAQIMFRDCFPVSLSGLDFDISNASTQYFQAQATFRYREFVVEAI